MTKIKMLCRNGALALSLLFVGVPAGYVHATDTTAVETTTPATTEPLTTDPVVADDNENNWGWIGLLGLLGLAGLMGRNRNEGRNVVVDGTKR
jgi:LPXTG-motif cell wall-anchored protein